MRKYSIFTWVIIFFFSLGVLELLIASPSTILIPVIVFGLIFYFFKNPEKLYTLRNFRSNRSCRGSRPKDKKSNNVSFKVIDGKFSEDDDKPKYH